MNGLLVELRRLNANMAHVAVCEGEKDDALCLVFEEEKWKVFFFERGSRGPTETYEFEGEACDGFLRSAKKDRGIVHAASDPPWADSDDR